MKSIPVAAIAVVVLWIGLSSFWMAGTGASQTVASASEPQAGRQAPQSCAMMTSMRGGADDGNMAMMPGSGSSSPPQGMMQGSDASIAGGTSLPSATQGIMTEPVAPMLGLQYLSPTPPAAADVMARLQALEYRLTAALDRLESTGSINLAPNATPGVDSQGSIQPSASWISQLLSVFASGPVIGFLLLLLLVLAATTRGGIVTRSRPLLAQMGLVRQDASPGVNAGSAGTSRVYGDVIHGTDANGKALQAGVFEEGQVRAAAGLTLALGAMAFGYAYFAQNYAPIQTVTTLFFFEFLIRVTVGIRYSPMGMIAHWMTRRQTQ